VVTRSPGAGSSYAPVINVSSNASSKDQKNARCPNCDMEISQNNKPLKCMECGAKFCENCEGFYRHEVRQRGEKPLCYKCYTVIAGELGKKSSEQYITEKPTNVINNSVQLRCPRCNTVNMSDSFFCVTCGTQISPKNVPVTTSPQANAPQVTQTFAPVNSPQVAQPSTKKTSAAWWLLPLFFTWVGGVIAWLVLRDSDKAKAKRLLIFGIVMVIIWIIIYAIAIKAGMSY
jgi:hypothetical protein